VRGFNYLREDLPDECDPPPLLLAPDDPPLLLAPDDPPLLLLTPDDPPLLLPELPRLELTDGAD
jgi:hypothetical protein